MQSRFGSFVESMINISIGFVINIFANMAILPAFGFPVTLSTNLKMGLVYTIISIVRSYVIRRWFNARIHMFAERVVAHDTK